MSESSMHEPEWAADEAAEFDAGRDKGRDDFAAGSPYAAAATAWSTSVAWATGYRYGYREARLATGHRAAPPTPATVPTVAENPRPTHRPWCDVVAGKITVEDPGGLSLSGVQALLDGYAAARDANPTAKPDAVAMGIAVASIMVSRKEILANPLTLAHFQEACDRTAAYPHHGDCQIYPLLGLVGEVGEMMAAVRPALLAAESTAPRKDLHTLVLMAAARLGEVAEVVKKAYRNADGQLRDEPRQRMQTALAALQGQVSQLASRAFTWDVEVDRVGFPPLRLNPEELDAFRSELGDSLWYQAMLAQETRSKLEDIARAVLGKLQVRASQGTLCGDGENR